MNKMKTHSSPHKNMKTWMNYQGTLWRMTARKLPIKRRERNWYLQPLSKPSRLKNGSNLIEATVLRLMEAQK